jgi:hypothetical protein
LENTTAGIRAALLRASLVSWLERFATDGAFTLFAVSVFFIHASILRRYIEISIANVIPDRERRKNSIVLSLEQNPNSVGLVFNGADGSPPEQLSAKYSATSARE